MITVHQVLQVLEEKAKTLNPVSLPILDCLGLVAAQKIMAPGDVPGFDNSAMDGYAFCFEDFQNNIPLKINYTIVAGTSELPILKKGEAARIFTGSPIPAGADTVIQQEICEIFDGELFFTKEINQGTNIRKQGTQTPKGSCILEKGSLLTAEYIGFLATFGISEIKVYPKPRVGIIVTGKELMPAGKHLKPGQIYDSNSVTLQAVLKKMNVEIAYVLRVGDQ